MICIIVHVGRNVGVQDRTEFASMPWPETPPQLAFSSSDPIEWIRNDNGYVRLQITTI